MKPVIGLLDSNDPAFPPGERDIGPYILDKGAVHERTVLTDRHIFERYDARLFAWMQESVAILPDAYEMVQTMAEDFELVFTHSRVLVEMFDNFRYCPAGGCWIPEIERQEYEKCKDVSILVSEKERVVGHIMRKRMAEAFPEYDAWGRGTKETESKTDMLAPYRFAVVIENVRSRGYFTEKLIDALVMRCVPIYWGDPDIFEIFEEDGIIAVSTCDEMARVLKNLPDYQFNETNRDIALRYADGAMNLWEAGLKDT